MLLLTSVRSTGAWRGVEGCREQIIFWGGSSSHLGPFIDLDTHHGDAHIDPWFFFYIFPRLLHLFFLFLQLVEHVIFRTPKISALKGHHDMTLKGICLMCMAWRVNHVRCRRACGDAVCLIQQGRAHQFFVLVGWSNHLSVMVDTWDSILLRPMFLGNVSQVRDHLEFALIRLLEDSLKHYCTI
jgi:hypothetical protein